MTLYWQSYADRIDWVALVRGASTGFSVLVVGGLAAPIMSNLPLVGAPWLIITAVVAFVVAGSRIGHAVTPAVQGASTAVAAYLLCLPLVVLATRSLDLSQLGLTMLTAVLMGGLAGHLAGRRRSRS